MRNASDWVDSIQKGKDIVYCLQFSTAYDRVTALMEFYPEVKCLTHRIIGELLGLQRETVSRVMNAEGIYRRVA
ncbi:MAG: hypothetical protein A2W23_03170 [Planctomycetes bacterium RBG_16_43_13]|nr:MAG: hypothetical protein A2W23_03170 [Planctomycetes bacterium RBG_16_43_13]